MADIGLFVKDENGNIEGKISYGSGDTEADQSYVEQAYHGAPPSTIYYYQDENGNEQHTFNPDKIPTRVSLNEDTGDIHLQVSPTALKNESFKNQVIPQLETLSQNYKAESDYKYNIVDANGNNQEKTIQDILNDMNAPAKNDDGSINQNSLDVMAQAAIVMEKTKEYAKDQIGQDWNDEDVRRLNTVTNPESKDDALQLISDLPQAEFLRKVGTYDSSTGMAQYKDLMNNAWSSNKVTDEQMMELEYALIDYFAKGDFSNKDEYIKNTATWRFIHDNQPYREWYNQVGTTLQGIGQNIITGLGQILGGVAGVAGDFFSGFREGANTFIENLSDSPADRLMRQEYELRTGVGNLADSPTYVPRSVSDFAELTGQGKELGMEKVDRKYDDVEIDELGFARHVEREVEGTWDPEDATNLFSQMHAINAEKQAIVHRDMSIVNEHFAAGKSVAEAADNLAMLWVAGELVGGAAIASFGRISAAVAKGASRISGLARNTAEGAKSAIESGRMAFATATEGGSIAANLANPATYEMMARGFGVIYDIANISGKGATLVNSIATFLRTSKAASGIVGTVASAISDSVVMDPARFSTIISDKEIDDDAKTLLMQNFVGNAVGWGVGTAAMKGLLSASKTRTGRAISFNASRKLFKVQNATGAAFDNLLLKIRRVGGKNLDERIKSLGEKKSSWAQKQAVSLSFNQGLRQARQVIADMDPVKLVGSSKEEIDTALKEAQDAILKLENAENAVTSAQRRGMDVVISWLRNDNFGLKPATTNFYKKAARVSELEKRAGSEFQAVKGAVTDLSRPNGRAVRLFSQTTANYIGATSELGFINAYIIRWENAADATEKTVKNIEAYKKEIPELEGMIKKFTGSATPELQQAVDEFIDSSRKWWNAFETFRSDKTIGLTSRDKLNRRRSSGLWGQNGELYARATRKAKLKEYEIRHRNGESDSKSFEDFEEYTPGATGDFADPMGEMQIAMQMAGNTYAYNNVIRSLNELTGSLTTKVAGNKVEFAETMMDGLKKNYEQTTKRLFAGLSENTSSKINEVIKNLKVKGESKLEVNKSKKALKTIEKRLDTEASPVTAKNANYYIRTLSNEETDTLWTVLYGKSTTDLFGTSKNGATVADILDKAEGVEQSQAVVRETQRATEPLESAVGQTAEKGGKGIAVREVLEAPRGAEEVVQTVVEPATGKGVPSQVRSLIYDKADKMGIAYDEQTPLSQIYREIKETTASPVFDDATFDTVIKQSLLVSDKSLVENKAVLDYLSSVKQARYDEKYLNWRAEQEENLAKFSEQYYISLRELDEAGFEAAEGYIDSLLREGSATRQTVEELCKYYKVEGDETAMRYFAMKAYMDNKSAFNKDLSSGIKEMIEKDHNELSVKERDKVAGVLVDSITKKMDNEANDLRLAMSDIAPEAVADENTKLFDEVSAIRDEIEGARKNQYTNEKNIVALRNPDGQLEYYQVDPLLAGLVNFRPARAEMGALARTIYNTNYLWTKLFRLGTTAINIKSLIMQSFRDPINMFVTGGAFHTIRNRLGYMTDVFGDDVAAYVRRFEPEAFAKLERTAEATGESVQSLAVKRELALGRDLSPSATETAMYRSLDTAREARITDVAGEIYDVTAMDRLVDSLDKVGNILGKPNEMREAYLRNVSYANGLAEGLERGYSLAQARTHAIFKMNEATTNFSRLTGHFTALRNSVPYLGAAINGTKSFWRLATIDPVGVMGRLVGGVIIPVMALVAYSLHDEENRKVYENIKEYEKQDNLVFVVDGQAFTIPLPQEMASFIAPFRQLVEGMHGAANNTFDQFFWNDILGFSPIELRGFADLDFSKLESSSPGFADRIGEGVMKMWAQLAPAPLKSGLEIITGVDPFTGRQVDTSYVDYDEDGNPIVKDYRSGVLARNINNMFNSWGWGTSAPVVQNVLSNIFGQASVDILDFLGSLAEAVPNGGLQWSMDTEALEKNEAYNPFYTLTERVTSPLTTEVYDEAQSAWKAAVTALYTQKDEILRSDAWQEYLEAKRNATDPEKLRNIDSSKKDLVENYFNTIKTVVTNLQKNYGEQFTAAKYATVLSLMTMDEQTLDGGSYGNYLNKEQFKTARAQAIQTMIQMGFPSATGQDILGQYRVNSDGEIYVQTNHPLAILQLDDRYSSLSSQSNKQHLATLRNIVSDNGLYDLRTEFYNARKQAYNAKDYDKADELTDEYNAKVLEAIDPYIQQYGAKSVLQGDTLKFLTDFIEPPSNSTVMGRAQYLSSAKTGVGLNKHDAFSENYLKTIYGLKELP